MGVLFVTGWIAMIGFCIWEIVSPQSVYWTLTARQYRNPEANEPSDLSYTGTRISAGVGLAVLVIGGFFLVSTVFEDYSHDKCVAEFLPELKAAYSTENTDMEALQAAADKLGLEIKGEGPWYKFHSGGRQVASVQPRWSGSNEITCD